MASPLCSEVSFGSYLVYSPKGTSDVSRRSRELRDAVKAGRAATLRNIAEHIARNLESSGLAAILGPDVTLVPCPRSSPLVEGALWPGKLMAEELVRVGLGRHVLLSLERVEAVPKSAFAARGNRPNAFKHYETIRATADLAVMQRVTIVDDFVTKGNTLLGAATRLAEVYPRVRLGVFAAVRTKGRQPEVDALVEPCVGRIWERSAGEADRDP
ncbi:MAG: phosphoribosyltransferase family protein [Myxococcales bacterium]|nr:phosphoribosyltransferase family protein [Myxococcales bacterium]